MSKAPVVLPEVTETLKLIKDRANALRDEREQGFRPYKSASDPVAMVAEGTLTDLSPLAGRLREVNGQTIGILIPIYATQAATAILQQGGVREGLYAALGAHERALSITGRDRCAFRFRPEEFAVEGGYLTYRPTPAANGSLYIVLAVRDEANPCWVPESEG